MGLLLNRRVDMEIRAAMHARMVDGRLSAVPLDMLRADLPHIARATMDESLLRMMRTGSIDLELVHDPSSLPARRRDAGIWSSRYEGDAVLLFYAAPIDRLWGF